MTPEQIYTLIMIAMSTGAICFCFWLYHKAHGRDVDAVRAGGELVMEAMRRNGTITGAEVDSEERLTAFNIEDDEEADLETGYDEALARITERSKKFTEQQAEEKVDAVMGEMSRKV